MHYEAPKQRFEAFSRGSIIAQYPERGPFLFGEGFGTRAKATADSIKALKGVQSQKRFSGSGDSKYKPQSRRQQWGVSSPNFQRSVFRSSSAWEHHPHGTSQPPVLSSGNLTSILTNPPGFAGLSRVLGGNPELPINETKSR